MFPSLPSWIEIRLPKFLRIWMDPGQNYEFRLKRLRQIPMVRLVIRRYPVGTALHQFRTNLHGLCGERRHNWVPCCENVEMRYNSSKSYRIGKILCSKPHLVSVEYPGIVIRRKGRRIRRKMMVSLIRGAAFCDFWIAGFQKKLKLKIEFQILAVSFHMSPKSL